MRCIWMFYIFGILLLGKGSVCLETKCPALDCDKQYFEKMFEQELEFRSIRNVIKQSSNKSKQCLENLKDDRKVIKQTITAFKDVRSKKLNAKVSELDEVLQKHEAVIQRISDNLQQIKIESLQNAKGMYVKIFSYYASKQ